MNQAEVDTTQLLKGVLDLAVLAVLADADSYGYDVVRRLRENGLDHVGDALSKRRSYAYSNRYHRKPKMTTTTHRTKNARRNVDSLLVTRSRMTRVMPTPNQAVRKNTKTRYHRPRL